MDVYPFPYGVLKDAACMLAPVLAIFSGVDHCPLPRLADSYGAHPVVGPSNHGWPCRLTEMTPKEKVHDPETDPNANAELDRS